jgi:hypothetical protein
VLLSQPREELKGLHELAHYSMAMERSPRDGGDDGATVIFPFSPLQYISTSLNKMLVASKV